MLCSRPRQAFLSEFKRHTESSIVTCLNGWNKNFSFLDDRNQLFGLMYTRFPFLTWLFLNCHIESVAGVSIPAWNRNLLSVS